ncbi:MAG: DUF5318 domain-containing protein [Actinomycetota bacterium]|nr:DUF5318 domain-containing protein [Actinomycetota bacterium]
MSGQRDVVDYALQRRALLTDVASGRRAGTEACDAHPYLLLAAKHYGQLVATPCPVCDHRHQRHVHYVYGNALGKSAGQAKSVAELAQLAREHAEFDVYVVEVCPDCRWNHLVRSFVLGRAADGELTAADG